MSDFLQPPGLTNRTLLRGGPVRRLQKPFNRTIVTINNRTGHVTAAMEGDFTWARMWVTNNLVTPYTITNATMQSSSTNTTNVPQDAALATRSMLQVYWNGAGLDTQPGSTDTTITTFVVPGSTALVPAASPAYYCSDWLLVPSIPRNDLDWRPYLMARCHSALDAQWSQNPDLVAWNTTPSVHKGRTWQMYDGAGNTTTGLTGEPTSLRTSIWGLEVIGNVSGRSVLALGDSIVQGNTTTGSHYNWIHVATAALSTVTTPIAYNNGGWAGQDMAQICTRGLVEIPLYKPDVVVIATWSPNDTNTAALAERSFGRAVSLAQLVRDRGGIPILWTPCPRDSLADVTADSYRRGTIAKLRNLQAAGWLIADVDAAVSTGANPNRFVPAYTVDGLHLNDAGNDAAAGALLPVLRQALRL